jgi:hypothetical protein
LPFRESLGLLTGDVDALWRAGAITREHARRLWDAFPLVVEARGKAGQAEEGVALLTEASGLADKNGERCWEAELLQEIYGWFTEGFDTADLKEARALLAALA